MINFKLTGLIAATYTPFTADGNVDPSNVGAMFGYLSRQQVDGLYVCGSTGEGVSMTGDERRRVAEAFVSVAAGEVPVIVQVGHNSLFEARDLAAHAQRCGATAVSANAPSYFKITDVTTLVDCMALVASGAPDLPFYYYHIPHLTGANMSMPEFLALAEPRIPNLAGLKYTAPTIHEYQASLVSHDGRFDILWGSDEMLLPALAVGANGAVGSTYNVAAPIYRTVMQAFCEGDLPRARHCQWLANEMIRIIYQWPFHPAMREVLKMIGAECGRCRLPHPQLLPQDVNQLRRQLDEIGFFDWHATGNPIR